MANKRLGLGLLSKPLKIFLAIIFNSSKPYVSGQGATSQPKHPQLPKRRFNSEQFDRIWYLTMLINGVRYTRSFIGSLHLYYRYESSQVWSSFKLLILNTKYLFGQLNTLKIHFYYITLNKIHLNRSSIKMNIKIHLKST